MCPDVWASPKKAPRASASCPPSARRLPSRQMLRPRLSGGGAVQRRARALQAKRTGRKSLGGFAAAFSYGILFRSLTPCQFIEVPHNRIRILAGELDLRHRSVPRDFSLQQLFLQLSRRIPRIDVAHGRGDLERALAHLPNSVAASALFLKNSLSSRELCRFFGRSCRWNPQQEGTGDHASR